jgi:hypothetical protein
MFEAFRAVWKWASTASRREENYEGMALTVSQLCCKTTDFPSNMAKRLTKTPVLASSTLQFPQAEASSC